MLKTLHWSCYSCFFLCVKVEGLLRAFSCTLILTILNLEIMDAASPKLVWQNSSWMSDLGLGYSMFILNQESIVFIFILFLFRYFSFYHFEFKEFFTMLFLCRIIFVHINQDIFFDIFKQSELAFAEVFPYLWNVKFNFLLKNYI